MRNRIIALTVVVAGAIGWYAFRPERLLIDNQVSEALPTTALLAEGAVAEPVALSKGTFRGVHHDTKGTATILKLTSGDRVLRLTDFETSNGPDVRVYLVAAPDAADNETVTKAGFIELGAMKGNRGDQNYEIPATVDLARYQTVTIWCKRFSVNFGSAALTAS
ncbi:MAG: DM13 domain-containing protein [Cytophagaceae bacterium]|nr:DM13 domain-containing protein [Gemmatimonadaceae bacterium]